MTTEAPEVKEEILIYEDQIEKRALFLAQQIFLDYAGKDPIAIAVLKGAAFFASRLLLEIGRLGMDVPLDFVQVSSYGNAKQSSGVVTILKEPTLDLRGRNILLIEDIIDSGLTIKEVRRHLLLELGAAEVKTVTMLDKPKARKVDFKPDYVGFAIEPRFVIGYGLDDAEHGRNRPDIVAVD